MSEETRWLHSAPTAPEDIPERLKAWAASPECPIADALNRDWYELEVTSSAWAQKVMHRGTSRGGTTYSDRVPHGVVAGEPHGTQYYAAEDPETGAVLWGHAPSGQS
jgi:hypothetical protein